MSEPPLSHHPLQYPRLGATPTKLPLNTGLTGSTMPPVAMAAEHFPQVLSQAVEGDNEHHNYKDTKYSGYDANDYGQGVGITRRRGFGVRGHCSTCGTYRYKKDYLE